MKDHLRDAWGFKGFVVSDCGAIVDVNQGHKKTPDIMHSAALSLQAGTDLSCSIWTPGFNTLADAVRKGLVSEDLVTQAAERLYTARFQLGLFDPPGSLADRIPFSSVASDTNRQTSRKAAEESIVLLKNNGALPLKAPEKIAVIGPTADSLPSILGNYVGTPLHPVTPLDGMLNQFKSTPILYAQGSTLAEGFGVPVPRTAFGLNKGLKTEFFATADWTGRPVATETEPARADRLGKCQARTRSRHPQLLRALERHHRRARARPLRLHASKPATASRTRPRKAIDSSSTARCLAKAVFAPSIDLSTMGNFQAAPGASPTAPPVMSFAKPAKIEVDFTDTKPHEFQLEYSHSGDQSGGGVTLKWEAPAQAQIDEAVARAKEADVVVAFVGLSPQLEGEEMPIKIAGFSGGDRTSLDLPAPQQKLLEALAATGKPLIVVLQSGSAVALNWANEHAAAVLEAWYPGVDGGAAIARTLAGLNNPAGRLPVTFYASLDGLPDVHRLLAQGPHLSLLHGQAALGIRLRSELFEIHIRTGQALSATLKAGDPITATVTVTNTGTMAGDEVVEAYLKTPQDGGPIHSLVGFDRVTIGPGASKEVTLKIDPRSLSSVDDQGNRSILAGKYTLTSAAHSRRKRRPSPKQASPSPEPPRCRSRTLKWIAHYYVTAELVKRRLARKLDDHLSDVPGTGVKKIEEGGGGSIQSFYKGLPVDQLSGFQSRDHLFKKSGNLSEVIRDDKALNPQALADDNQQVARTGHRRVVAGDSATHGDPAIVAQ